MEHPPDARSPGVLGSGAGNEPQESEQSGVRRMSSGGSEEPSPSVASAAAAPQFSARPVEQRGVGSPRLGRRRDKASLAQTALRKKHGDAPKPAGRDGAILPLQAPTGRTEFNKGWSNPGENRRAGGRAQSPLQAGRRAREPSHYIPVLQQAGTEPFSTASVYLGGEKSRCSAPAVAFSR